MSKFHARLEASRYSEEKGCRARETEDACGRGDL